MAAGTLEGLDMWRFFHTEGFDPEEVNFTFDIAQGMTRGRVLHHAAPSPHDHEPDPEETCARGSTRSVGDLRRSGLCTAHGALHAAPTADTTTKGGARMHALIEADGLSKRFGKVQALSELTLTLPAGPARGHPRAERRRQDDLHPHGGDA